MKTIIVEMTNNPHWENYGTIEVRSDTIQGYRSFKTHQENPIKYAKNLKEYKSGKYELIIKN
jgi:hypothetical protein